MFYQQTLQCGWWASATGLTVCQLFFKMTEIVMDHVECYYLVLMNDCLVMEEKSIMTAVRDAAPVPLFQK